MQVDLLQGKIGRALGRLALPIMLSSLLQMAYSLVDLFWVGQLNASAVVAVGTGALIMWFLDGLMHLARMGGQVYTAQSIGAGQIDEARAYASASLQTGAFLGLSCGLLIFFFHTQIIGFFGFHELESIRMSELYLLYFGGFASVHFLVRISTALLTATGNSKTPFILSTIGIVLNLVLDPFFIFTLNLGVLGAALATITAQAVVLLLFIPCLRSNEVLRGIRLGRFYPHHYGRIVRLGLPVAAENLFPALTAIILSKFIAYYGDLATAAQRIGVQLESLSWMTTDGFASAVNVFIAQNVGAKQGRRARLGFRHALTYVTGFGLMTTALFLLFPSFLMGIFLHEPQAVAHGVQYLRVLALSQVLLTVEIVTASAFASYGQTLLPASLITSLTLARIPMVLLFTSLGWGLMGIWWAVTLSTNLKGLSLLMSFLWYRQYRAEPRLGLCLKPLGASSASTKLGG